MLKNKSRIWFLLGTILLAVVLIFIFSPNDHQRHSTIDNNAYPITQNVSESDAQGNILKKERKINAGNPQGATEEKNLVSEINQIFSLGDDAISIGNSYRLIELLNQLSEINPDLAIHYLNKNPSFLVFQANKKIIEKLYSKSPEKLKEFIGNRDGINSINQIFLSDCLSVIISNDYTSDNQLFVKSIVESNPNLTAGFLSYLGYGDISAAIELRNTLILEGSQASEFDAAIGLALLESNPLKAIEYFGDLKASNLTKTQDQLANVLARDYPELFSQFAEQCSPSIVSSLLNNRSTMAEILKTENLPAFGKMLQKIPITEENLKHYTNYSVAITMLDSEKGFIYVNSLPEGPSKDSVLSAVISKYYGVNPEKSASILSGLNPHSQEIAARAISKNLAQGDPANALMAISSNPILQKTSCYREVAKASALNHPTNAIKIIEDAQMSEKIGKDFRNEMINYTVQNWAKQNREAAQQWVEKLPAADQPKGTQGLVSAWMKTDPIAASEWLSNQPAGPARDAGAREIIKQIKDTDPAIAKQWRDSMTPK